MASTPLRAPLNFARIAFLSSSFSFLLMTLFIQETVSPSPRISTCIFANIYLADDENRVFNMMQCLLPGPRNPLPLGAA